MLMPVDRAMARPALIAPAVVRRSPAAGTAPRPPRSAEQLRRARQRALRGRRRDPLWYLLLPALIIGAAPTYVMTAPAPPVKLEAQAAPAPSTPHCTGGDIDAVLGDREPVTCQSERAPG
jgi:hypothetical protein